MARSARIATGEAKGRAPAQFRLPSTITRSELLDAGGDHRFRTLIYELGYLSDLLDEARRHLAAALGLSPPQYAIVMVIAQLQETRGVSVVEIANQLHVTGAFITTQAHELVANGMV